MIKSVHIYDMDGCLVDSMHRFRILKNGKINLSYWIENEHKAFDDSLLPLAKQYKDQLNDPEIYVIIATARVLNEPDLKFINEVLGEPDKIISRRNRQDNRKGSTLKIQGLYFLRNLKQFKNAVVHFYEDNFDYLIPVCKSLNCRGYYIPSEQGV